MKLKVIGSSSSGNCYLLENRKECLILEAGIDPKKILLNIEKVVGCLITHEHKDHCKYTEYLKKMAINIYASKGTIEVAGLHGHRIKEIKALNKYHIGNFIVLPFNVKHDAKEPLGFLIKHPDMGTLLFVTDTYYIENRFSDLNHIMIECNYDNEILSENMMQGKIPKVVRDRTLASHMSMETCINFLKNNDLTNVYNIVLIHLSSQNSNKKMFQEVISRETNKEVYIAFPKLEIELNSDIF